MPFWVQITQNYDAYHIWCCHSENTPGSTWVPWQSNYGTCPEHEPHLHQLLPISYYNRKTSVLKGKYSKALLLGENRKQNRPPLMAERKRQIQGSLCEALENIRVMFQKLNNFTQWKKTLTATGACLDYCCFVIQLPTIFLTAFSQTTICILIQMKLCPDTDSFERISGEIIIMFSKHIHSIHSVQTNVKSHRVLTVCLRVELSQQIVEQTSC